MKQREARVLQNIVNETYSEFEQIPGTDGFNGQRWTMPLAVNIAMRKQPCIYCDNKILLGQFKTTHGAHLACWEARFEDSKRLIDTIKARLEEQGLELEVPMREREQ